MYVTFSIIQKLKKRIVAENHQKRYCVYLLIITNTDMLCCYYNQHYSCQRCYTTYFPIVNEHYADEETSEYSINDSLILHRNLH